MNEQSIYEKNGYANREDYLKSLAADHGLHYDTVRAISDMLGENEDFDGLVTSLEDYALYG